MDDAAADCTDAFDLEVPNPPISKEAPFIVRKSGTSGYEKRLSPKGLGKKDRPFEGNVRNNVPKDIDRCEGACTFVPDFGLQKTSTTFLADMADFFSRPMLPDAPRAQVSKGSPASVAEVDRVHRLWELRMCIDMLHDSMEIYEMNGERDILSTADETLDRADETLRRIAEIGFAHGGSSSSASSPVGSTGAEFVHQDPATALMNAIRSDNLQPQSFTHCLLASRLGISGLLEAVLGELTDWRTQPSESDLQVWRSWDKKYELLARRAGRLPGAGFNAGQREDVRRRESAAAPSGPLCATGVSECLDARSPVCPATLWEPATKTVCTPLCGSPSEVRR